MVRVKGADNTIRQTAGSYASVQGSGNVIDQVGGSSDAFAAALEAQIRNARGSGALINIQTVPGARNVQVAQVTGSGNMVRQSMDGSGSQVARVSGRGAVVRQSMGTTPMVQNRGVIRMAPGATMGMRVNGRTVPSVVENSGLIIQETKEESSDDEDSSSSSSSSSDDEPGTITAIGAPGGMVCAIDDGTGVRVEVNGKPVDMDAQGRRDYRLVVQHRPSGSNAQWVSVEAMIGKSPNITIKAKSVGDVRGNRVTVDARKGKVGYVSGAEAHVVAEQIQGGVRGTGCTVVTKAMGGGISGTGATVHYLQKDAHKDKERQVVTKNRVAKRSKRPSGSSSSSSRSAGKKKRV